VRGRLALIVASAAIAGCYQSASDDDAAPRASSIPTAAYSAVGVDYPPPGAAAAGTTGIAECDAYFAKIESCRGVPPSTRSALIDAAKAMRKSIAQATTPEMKEAIRESCKAATDALTVCDTHL
jgi:hypothetical protein